jgi:hypothetical protein
VKRQPCRAARLHNRSREVLGKSSLTTSAKPVGVGAACQPVIGDFRIDTRTEIWITGRGEQNCAGNLGAALCVER